MANFTTHLVVGSTVCGIAATTLNAINVLTPDETVWCFTLGTFGSLLPDVDSDHSVVIRILFSIAGMIAAFFSAFQFSSIMYIAEILLLWFAAFGFIYFVVGTLFRHFTEHRGIFHSIPAALLWGLLITYISYSAWYFSELTAWIMGVFMLTGYIIHLLLDEIASVDLTNQRIKRSFGTALKLWQRNNIYGTLLLYVVIASMFLLVPPPAILADFIASHQWNELIRRQLLPPDGWFIQFR